MHVIDVEFLLAKHLGLLIVELHHVRRHQLLGFGQQVQDLMRVHSIVDARVLNVIEVEGFVNEIQEAIVFVKESENVIDSHLEDFDFTQGGIVDEGLVFLDHICSEEVLLLAVDELVPFPMHHLYHLINDDAIEFDIFLLGVEDDSEDSFKSCVGFDLENLVNVVACPWIYFE